jgi:hypothetical protein
MMSSLPCCRRTKRQTASPSRRADIMHRNFVRACVTSTAIMVLGSRAAAQQLDSAMIELRPFVGAIIGTGEQADALKNSVIAGAQVSYNFIPHFAVVGSVGWSRSQDKRDGTQPKLDLYQFDLGLEWQWKNMTASSAFATRPYAALGGGSRTYSLRDVPNSSAQTNAIFYTAVGLDVYPSNGRVGVRLEARGNMTDFNGFRGEIPSQKTRNDVQLSAGLTIGF